MQLTINLSELTIQKRLELFALLGLVDDNHPKQATLPMSEEVVNEEPVKKRSVSKNKVPTSDEKPKEVSEPTQEVKTPSVSLQEVKELAQAMVAKHDRESVKAIISVYGEKLTEVKESDYQKLFDALSALNDAN